MTTLSIATVALVLMVGVAGSIIGGALSGIVVGGKSLGSGLAAMMGAVYGPMAGLAGVFIGLVILHFIG